MSHRSSLYLYYLKSLCTYFGAVLVASTATFLCSYYLLTVRFFSGAVISMRFFYYLTPQMLSYTIPFSCMLALGVQHVHSIARREDLIRKILRHAHRAWWRARATLSALCIVLFVVVIGWWGPLSHSVAKKTLVGQTVDLIRRIPPQHITALGQHVRLWYARKLGPCWYQVRLLRTYDDNSVVFLSARLAQQSERSLVLYSGTLMRIQQGTQSRSDFTVFTLSYDEIQRSIPSFAQRRPKHYSFSQLRAQPLTPSIRQELWRRYFQIFLFMLALVSCGLIIDSWRIKRMVHVILFAGAFLVFIHAGSSMTCLLMS